MPPPLPETIAVATPEPVAAQPIEEVPAAPVAEKSSEVEPTPEPVVAAPPVVEVASAEPVVEKLPELEPTPEPVVAAPPVVEVASAEPVVEKLPELEPTPEPVVAAPPIAEVVATEPVVEKLLEVEPTPEPAVAAPLVAEVVATEPAAEKLPELEPTPVVEPIVAAPPVAEVVSAEPVVEPPIIESVVAAPLVADLVLVEPTPTVEPVVAVQTLAEELPEPVHAEIVAEPIVEAAAVAEASPAEPVAEAVPVHDATSITEPVAEILPVAEAGPAAEPVAIKPNVPEPEEAPIKLHDVPDPLLALAEEIRAAQAARAVALAAPQTSAGLLELVEAVGVQEQSPEQAAPAPQVSEAISHPVASAVPTEKIHVAEEAVAAVAVASTAVALLEPPSPIESEPVGFHELRPAALSPEQLPTAEPERVAEPQVQPVALAPEPQPEPEPEGPMLPFAPMQEYTPATSRSILPVPPPPQILSAEPGPRITLPGPTLPPELTRLHDANVVTVIGEDTAQRTKEALPPPKREGAPGWVVSVLVMLLLLAAGLGIVFYLLPHTVADAKPAPTPAVAATTPAPTGGNSPLAKFIEVTGFRIVTSSPDASKKDTPKKSEVQYLIVNHSDADISDANVFVTLRPVKPGQAPLCRFSFKVPSLGPFESKEMSSPIGNSTRAVSLPDWQEIRAEVQISQ